MTEDQGKGRFAELTIELFGAKMARDLFAEVWANATPEVKSAIANDVLERLRGEVGRSSLHGAVDQITSEAARRAIAEIVPDLREQAIKLVRMMVERGVLETEVRRVAESFIRDVAAEACRDAARKIAGTRSG